jgi:sec-independent protein translocase protein TatB
MFDISWTELVLISVVALIAIGPKELPGVLRTLGTYMRKIRGMATEFQGQFHEAMREAEMADLKKSVDEMADTAKSFTDFDPLGSVRKEIDSFSADPFKDTSSSAQSAALPDSATPESFSPEAAAANMPAPVPPDAAIPQPSSDTAVTPEAPQPQEAVKSDAVKSGSGA